MALTEDRNGPENSKLLNGKITCNNHKENHHGNLEISNKEAGGGDDDHTVIIEMVPPLVSSATDGQVQNEEHAYVDGKQLDHKPDEYDLEVDDDNGGEEDEYNNIFEENCFTCFVERVQEKVHSFIHQYKSLMLMGLKIGILLGYFAYFCYCMSRGLKDEGAYRLLLCTVVGVLILVKRKIPFRCSMVSFTEFWGGNRKTQRLRWWAKLVLSVGMMIFMVVFVVVNVAQENQENLQSLIGLLGFIALLFLVSKNPAKVNWYTVLWGIAIQWLLAVIILRTHWGLVFFEWIGARVSDFLKFALAGAEFVFGKDYTRHRLAMLTVSIMLYFNSVIHILFHLGAIQAVINSFGRFLAFCLGTNPIESFAASANIFISLTEAPMLLRPFLKYMTKSELHTLMTCGFASISGSVLGTYISFKIEANHLLTASVMSAPAALAFSKLLCPETERSKLRNVKSDKIGMLRYKNILEAASTGATQAVPIAASTLANQIAFVSLLAFFNATLEWVAERGGFAQIDFKWVCSYLFYPMVFAMGADHRDCGTLGSLLGVKLFGTPIMSYTELGNLRTNRMKLEKYMTATPNATWQWQGEDILLGLNNVTLVGGVISERSEVIATYMLCGFSTITSIGVCLGVLLPLAESRKKDVVDLVISALIAGNFASFFTAAVVGLMFNGKPLPT